jgi:phosphoglycolate phosphatase
MPTVTVNGRGYEIALIVFDKDGTLTDLDAIWGNRAYEGIVALAMAAKRPGLVPRLSKMLGLDPVTKRTLPGGPLAVTTMSKLYTISAAALYQDGFSWEESEALVMAHFKPPMVAAPKPDQVVPLADIFGLFSRLQSAGVRVAVATSDDRHITSATLEIMGVAKLVDALVCGDDDLPNKPSPEGLQQICAQLSIPPERVMMVGDSVGDMAFGRNAGVACCVGVLGPDGDRALLAPHADQLVDGIDEIEPV